MPNSEPAPSDRFRGLRATVMGLGRFGGGAAAAAWLARRGARVTVTDLQTELELSRSLAQLNGLPIHRFVLGRHEERDFREADLVVVNPAVPPSCRFLELARQAGVALTSEMNLFWQANRGCVIGVTGTSGKSTTAALIHSLLKSAGQPCWIGGNIGHSLLADVDSISADDWVVLELSSFQLEDLDRLESSPDIAVVTNFAPNHLDRHKTLGAYRHAKQTILRWQQPSNWAVLNADDSDVAAWPVSGRVVWFGERAARPAVTLAGMDALIDIDSRLNAAMPLAEWLPFPGRHNLLNAAAAIAAAAIAGVDPGEMRRGIEAYQPLPHRLQFIGEVAGRRFYNDSKATTPESAIAAIGSFEQPIVILAGGSDKGVDLDQMARAIASHCRAAALLGQTAAALHELIERHAPHGAIQTARCGDFQQAFEWACRHSQPGDVILLSPGCASYGWFRDFTERGERFVELVQRADSLFAASTA